MPFSNSRDFASKKVLLVILRERYSTFELGIKATVLTCEARKFMPKDTLLVVILRSKEVWL